MDPRLTRRDFLAGAATILGAAACSKTTKVIHVGSASDAANQLNLLVTSGAVDGSSDQSLSVFVAGIPQRVAFILAGASGFLAPPAGSVQLQVGPDEKHFGPPLPVVVHADTGATAAVYVTATYQFPKAGTYWLRATYRGETTDSPVVVIDQSAAKVPYAGQHLISTPTPTSTDSRGVNPICTQTPTFCPFHSISLDQAMTMNKPIALVFATPALCQTATCGPVLENVEAAAPAFGDEIIFIHSEIFVGLSRNDPNTPAVVAYHLQSEPLLFLANAQGTVVERIDGLFGRSEAMASLSRLVG